VGRPDQAIHDSGEFSALYLRAMQSFTDLDAVSKLGFSAFQNRFFRNFEAMYFSHCDGLLTAPLWDGIKRILGDLLAYPGVRQWWETRELSRYSGRTEEANGYAPGVRVFSFREIRIRRLKAPSNPYILYENEHCCALGEEGGLH
jgi:hypothetical protein